MARPTFARAMELVRYYQAGVVNTLFGLGLYAALVWLGLDMFVAQLVAHLVGMAFNYFSYSRHVFRDAGPAKLRFVISYAVNYVVSVAVLAGVSRFVDSPYLAGFLAAFIVSILNYFGLKHLVFRPKTT
jgi:putative flippase GtrA